MVQRSTLWQTGFSVVLILLGAFVFVDMADVGSSSGYDSVGARFFPYLAATGLVLTGTLNLAKLLRAGIPPVDQLDLLPVLLVGSGLLIQAVLLQHIGWIATSTLQFVLTAYAFGRFGLLQSATFGVVMAVVTYVVFAEGLGLDLPLLPLMGI